VYTATSSLFGATMLDIMTFTLMTLSIVIKGTLIAKLLNSMGDAQTLYLTMEKFRGVSGIK
jgi:hypothetical protein